MVRKVRNFAFAGAALAVAATGMMPAAAAELPRISSSVADTPAAVTSAVVPESAYNHRYRRYRHRGVDAGDVLAGVLILGGIAAVADAAKRSEERRERYPEPYPRPYPQDRGEWNYRGQADRYESGGLDRAVDICVAEVERRDAVGTVEEARRDGSGWSVEGYTQRGDGWRCRIGNDGRIETVDVDGDRGASYDSDERDGRYDDYYGSDAGSVDGDRVDAIPEQRGWADDDQYDDDVYARARSGAYSEPYEATPAASPVEDGRYGVGGVGDFEG